MGGPVRLWRPLAPHTPLLGELVAEAFAQGAEESRDLHLADAEALADLALAHLVDEPQLDQPPVAGREAFDCRPECREVDRRLDALVLAPDRVDEAVAVVVAAGQRRVERHR